KPDRSGLVAVVLLEPELALDQVGATPGVDQPTRAGLMNRAPVLVSDPMAVSRAVAFSAGEVETANYRPVEEAAALLDSELGEIVLEQGAIELVAGGRQEGAGPEL